MGENESYAQLCQQERDMFIALRALQERIKAIESDNGVTYTGSNYRLYQSSASEINKVLYGSKFGA